MSLPRYLEYKGSRVEWLGEVPRHWSVAPLKRGYEVCLGKMLQTEATSDHDALEPYLRAANIRWGFVDLSDVKSMWITPRDRVQLALQNGDLLVSEGGDVGRSALWRNELSECFIQNSVNRVRGRECNSTAYLLYWMATIKAKGYIDVLCNKSTIAHFTAEKVAAVPTPFPPYEEQICIAAFLDRETGKIDALIAEQKKLLTLLAEKRQLIISNAVTRGLNPEAPMKNSDIPWLGEVPAHWEVIRLGALYREVSEEGANDLPVLSVSIHDGVSDRELGDVELDRKVVRSEDRSKYKRVLPNDLTYNMMRAWQGAFGTVVVRGQVSPAYVVARPLRELRTAFVEHLLRSPLAIEQVRRYSRGITEFRLRLYWEEFKNIRIAIPSLIEQDRILAAIDARIGGYEKIEAEVTRAMDILAERRSALIAAAVTGKVDVRNAMQRKAQAA